MRLLLLLALLLVVCGGIFTGARRVAASRRARTGMIIVSAVGIVAGLWVAFVLPRRVPDTPGSPAMLVGVLALWFIGGGTLVVSVPSLIGAALARPAEDLER